VNEIAYVGLGSNRGTRAAALVRSLCALRAVPGVEILRTSRIYETRPVGPPQRLYLNAAAAVQCHLQPKELLEHLLAIEREAGRVRGAPNAPRTLDLDLLFFGTFELQTPKLVLPHPRLHERAFVLVPLSEIAPHFVHPALGASVEDLAARVRDPEAVWLWRGSSRTRAAWQRLQMAYEREPVSGA